MSVGSISFFLISALFLNFSAFWASSYSAVRAGAAAITSDAFAYAAAFLANLASLSISALINLYSAIEMDGLASSFFGLGTFFSSPKFSIFLNPYNLFGISYCKVDGVFPSAYFSSSLSGYFFSSKI